MGARNAQSSLWSLIRRQHGVVTRRQLLEFGFTQKAIVHRIRTGRLHPLYRGVYVVGRPELTRHGKWMAAVLSCGDQAVLSHASAAALWGIRDKEGRQIEISVPGDRSPRHPGIRVHRRAALTARDVTKRHGIPVTTPACTLIDIAPRLDDRQRETAINEADKLDLIDPERLRKELDRRPGRAGTKPLKKVLDRHSFVLTTTELERLFAPIAKRAGLPKPETQAWVNGFRVDFYWPDLGLVVEVDSLRYHRTPAQQARDVVRDQVHAVGELIPLRFTYAQVAFEPGYVEGTVRAVATRLAA
jgi:predicted transcriptional regulator of viral defense system/very-short-patch-repair endonuclease